MLTTTTTRLPRRLALTGTLALAGGAMLLAACHGERSAKPPRQFFPDMDDSPKWKPQSGSQFFVDGRTMRPRVASTVAFGRSDRLDDPDRASFLKDGEAFFYGTNGTNENGLPVYVDRIPLVDMPGWPADAAQQPAFLEAMIRRGQERFNIYCTPCHGYKADGRGMVGERWATLPANLHDPKYLDRAGEKGPDGLIFHTIRNGVIDQAGVMKMPSYAHAVNEYDAWCIAAYVRTLQASWTTSIDEVPQAERERLMKNPPKAPTEGGATPPAQTSPTPAPASGGAK
jgi:mono/diheme cytochrome c family protein